VLKRFVLILTNLMMAILIVAALGGLVATASAQSSAPPAATGTLRGQVTDPSGAVVANTTVAILVSGGPTHSATTGKTGNYEIGNLAPGKYTVTANAQGFPFLQDDVEVAAGQAAQFNIALEINVSRKKSMSRERTPTLDVNPANNASAIVLSGKDLEALPDDPDELLADLQALAGPFSRSRWRAAVHRRIHRRAASAEVVDSRDSHQSKSVFGRIRQAGLRTHRNFHQTRDGQYHGQFSVVGNDSGLNTRNPFLGDAPQAPYDSVIFQGNMAARSTRRHRSFSTFQRRNIDEIAVVDATILGTNFQPTAFDQSVPNPHTRTNLSPRIDYQVGPNNTLTTRYQYYRDTQQNAGVGGLVLPEAGYDTSSTEHTVQISDTQIFGTKL